MSLAALVGRIDANRGGAGLSGAVRVWVLDYYRRNHREPPASCSPSAHRTGSLSPHASALDEAGEDE